MHVDRLRILRKSQPAMAEQAFKNVRVLKGIPVDQFMATMGFFSASLGETLFTAIVDVVVAKVLAGRDEEPPLQTPVPRNQPSHWI